MKVLLDTHVFIWMLNETEKLSHKAERILRDPEKSSENAPSLCLPAMSIVRQLTEGRRDSYQNKILTLV
ncbi:MAG: hypothetical protein KJ666_11885 [Bacteroidetes bacterium]|nr:hypothetical protein [Bacteroidota bacterium]